MNKKRVQEVSRKQKPLAKRLSAVVLHSKTDLIQSKSPGRPPSPCHEIGIQHGDAETCRISPQTPPKNSTPKMKFTSNDKSSDFRRASSPRLKSFPAEELRRFDASPRVEVTPPAYQIYGQGDGLNANHQVNFQNQPNHPEVFNVVPLERSPERQHRPSVPRPQNHQEKMPTEHQSEGNFTRKREFIEEMEKNPVGGRNAQLFAQQMEEQNHHKNFVTFSEQKNPQFNQKNHVRFAEVPQEIPPGFSREIPQQVIQEMPHEINPENYYIPQQFIQQFGGLGMTSPQDVMINQSRMYQYGMQPHLNHQEHIGNSTAPNQQISTPNKFNNQQDMIPQHDQPGNDNQQLQASQQPTKPLQFTPEMIKAQEKLLKTLHQQGLPDDTIKRQFEGLLSQQRNELEYTQQLEAFQSSQSVDDKVTMEPRRRRRITKIEEDGKPEWMMHITPPWVSLAELEEQRIRDENKKEANRRKQEESEVERSQEQIGNCQQMMSPAIYQQQQMMIPQVQQQQQQQYQQQAPQNYHQMGHNYPQIQQNGYHIQNPYQVPQNNRQMGQYHMCNHQHHQQPQINYQTVAHNNHVQQHQSPVVHQQPVESQNHENLLPQEEKPRLEPSSLLKLKMYKDVVKRQKQNNGLQDVEDYKEAMAALKNPENRKGLEYLDNLEKKQREVKLNGIQEAHEVLKQSWPHKPPEYIVQQSKRPPRANGLENSWNAGRPPTPRRQISGNEPMPVYPNRADNPQNYSPAFQNIDNQFQAQVYGHDQGGSSQGQNCALWKSNSLPFDMYSQNRQNYPEIPRASLGGQGDTQVQMRHFEEPRVIGGVTYYGRKPEFIQNSRQYF